MLLFGILLLGIIISVIVTLQQVQKALEQESIAASIAQGASELSYLTSDYLIYQESAQLNRWKSKFSLLSDQVSRLNVTSPEQIILVRDINLNKERLKDVFDNIVSGIGNGVQNPGAPISQTFLQVSWSRMAIQSQGLISDASRLSGLQDDQANELLHTNIFIIFSMIVIFGAFFVTNYLLIKNRMLKSILAIHEGTTIIGSGNLDFAIAEKTKDEIGDLARAFNKMAVNLKSLTASKWDLEKEISGRKRIETALLREKETLQVTMENINTHLAYLDPAFNFVRVNSAYVRSSGYTTQELIGKNHFTLFPDAENQAVFEQVRDSGKAIEFKDKPFNFSRQPDGVITYWDWTLTPVKSPSGTVGGLVLSLIDTTTRKKLDELKDEFLSMVSHEMRTPLTVIVGALHTIMSKEELLSPEEKHLLIKDAVMEAEELSHLLANLLELSRVQSNRLLLTREPIKIDSLVCDIVEQLKSRTSSHTFSLDLPKRLPVVYADSLRLEHIIKNLLENAMKYSPERSEIKVSLRSDHGNLMVSVQDQGAGISKHEQEKLFMPFERLSYSSTNTVKGTGVGLLVCKRLVEAHDGRIWLDSEPGKGSTFRFTLPLDKELNEKG